MSDETDGNLRDSGRQPPRSRLMRDVKVAVLVTSGLSLIAAVNEIIDIFSRPRLGIALVFGAVIIVAGAVWLTQLWGFELRGVAVAAIASLAAGSMLFGVAAGHMANQSDQVRETAAPSSTTNPTSQSSTTDPAVPALTIPGGSPISAAASVPVEIISPKEGYIVGVKDPTFVRANSLPQGREPWVILRSKTRFTDTAWPQRCSEVYEYNQVQLLRCDTTFGDKDSSKGSVFEITVVLADPRQRVFKEGESFNIETDPLPSEWVRSIPVTLHRESG